MDINKITIVLDKERQMKLTWKGISEFEQATGVDISEVTDINVLTPRETYVLVWACLIREDPALTIENVTALIEQADMGVLLKALLECIANSFPEVKPETTPLAPETPAEQIGTDSGALPSTTSASPKFLS